MKIEKELLKAAGKIAKWHSDKCKLQIVDSMGGFVLTVHGDAQVKPTIGMIGEQTIGSLDDYDVFAGIMGYEMQVERVLFDPERARFILDAGWTSKFWRTPDPKTLGTGEFAVNTVPYRLSHKTSVAIVTLIAMVSIESSFKERTKRFVRKTRAGLSKIIQKKT